MTKDLSLTFFPHSSRRISQKSMKIRLYSHSCRYLIIILAGLAGEYRRPECFGVDAFLLPQKPTLTVVSGAVQQHRSIVTIQDNDPFPVSTTQLEMADFQGNIGKLGTTIIGQQQQLPSKAVVDAVVKLSDATAIDDETSPIIDTKDRMHSQYHLRRWFKVKKKPIRDIMQFVDSDFEPPKRDVGDGDAIRLEVKGNSHRIENKQHRMNTVSSNTKTKSSKDSAVKIIAADVAAEAGVSLSRARKDLALLATISRGGIAVSDEGELIYTFPKQLVSILSQNSRRYSSRQAWEKAWPKIFYGIRLTFGVVLLSSLGLSAATLAALTTASNSDDGGSRNGISLSYYLSDPFLWDFLTFRQNYGYYGDLENDRSNRRVPTEMRFFDSVFSYVFGDGNPNFNLQQMQLLLAARVIRENGGVVIAEQLAPYLDVPDVINDGSLHVDESFVLPIVAQLGGEPVVTDDGDIVYVFDELTLSTSNLSTTVKDIPPSATFSSPMAKEKEKIMSDILLEREHRISVAPTSQIYRAAGFGILNLGVVALAKQALSKHAGRLPGAAALFEPLSPILLLYALSYNLIPLGRKGVNALRNSRIRRRNTSRQGWKERLASRSADIDRKLEAAIKLRSKDRVLDDQSIVFDSRQTIESLQMPIDEFNLRRFDDLLAADDSPKSTLASIQEILAFEKKDEDVIQTESVEHSKP